MSAPTTHTSRPAAAVLGQSYRPRVIDDALTGALKLAGGLLVKGARGCDKTMTALNRAACHVFLVTEEAATIRPVSLRALLDGAAPRLLDEWQLAPELWNSVRRKIDASVAKGLFVLTGSAVPADDETRHTGAVAPPAASAWKTCSRA
ncbi:MAG: hypothetical protein LBO20_05820 [Bifidobacteriaceae bacterium]|jgi:hypothetical protein|nr:hypothetical protein [Bifidobacteriaceae bacterium]